MQYSPQLTAHKKTLYRADICFQFDGTWWGQHNHGNCFSLLRCKQAWASCSKGLVWWFLSIVKIPVLLVFWSWTAKQVTPNVSSFCSVIGACERANQRQLASRFLKAMQAAGIKPTVEDAKILRWRWPLLLWNSTCGYLPVSKQGTEVLSQAASSHGEGAHCSAMCT